jgi:hypothetical protein
MVFAACFVLALVLPASALGSFGVSKWEAGTCKVLSCTDAGSHEDFYTQAAGHPDFGITDFSFNYREVGLVTKAKEPEGNVKDVRVDLPPGLAVNPEATREKCTEAQLDAFECPAESEVGEDEATGTAELVAGQKTTVTEHFPVYNMVRKEGQPARFGVEINSSTVRLLGLEGHLYLEGAISWHKEPETSEDSGVATGDYHEFFRIENIPTQPEVVESKLEFWGVPQEHTGVGTPTAFLTLPSTCTTKPITRLHVDSYAEPGHYLPYENQTPVTATGCSSLGFDPSLALGAEPNTSDQPDGASVDLNLPQPNTEPAKTDSPDPQSTEVTLPAGMTLNPSAANGLEACTDAQIEIGSDNPIGCPGGSVIGSIAVNAPGIPNGSLTGHAYLAAPEPGQNAESGHEYRIFLAAEAPQYGVGLRLEGEVHANAQTGQLTAVFTGLPQVPFEAIDIKFNGGPRAPLANPLSCGAAEPSVRIAPYTGQAPVAAKVHGFVVEGGSCPSPEYALAQSIAPQSPTQAGAYSPFTLELTRGDGQQYPSQIQTTLPPGLLGAIPSVTLCGEPQASQGSCSSASLIGTVTVAAGAGSEPFTFKGSAYLTGPYNGAPYGLSIVVPAIAGPYNLGNVITRATVNVGVYSGRVTVTATLPTIVEGVPLRLKSLSVSVNRQSFLFNPTSCELMATESLLTSTSGATQSLSSPFQVSGCGSLAFKPTLAVSAGAKTSKRIGAGIEVKIAQPPHEANIRQVVLTLPKVLPARLSTLQKACTAASFEAVLAPGSCSTAARVGSVTVTTPVLPGALRGPAYLVSHGGAAFPDLDLVLQGDGIEVVLVGHTRIAGGTITSNFEGLPDVPISSVAVSLPVGPDSVLGINGSLCSSKLIAPTAIVAQSGARVTQNTAITVTGCPLKILSHRIVGSRAIITVRAPAKGRLSVSGPNIRRMTRRVSKAGAVKLSVPLSADGLAAVRRHGKLKIKLRVGFVPVSGAASAASLMIRFR